MSRLSCFNYPERVQSTSSGSVVGMGTDNPLGFSNLGDLYKMYFIVRKWIVTSDAKWEVPTPVLEFNNITESERTLRPYRYRRPEEERIEIDDEAWLTVRAPEVSGTGIIEGSGRFLFYESIPFTDYENVVYFFDGKYYPVIFINLSMGVEGTPRYLASTRNIAPGTETGFIDLTYGDINFSMPYFDYTGEGTVTASEMIITPSEYWPHNDGTGPAYNSVTGAYLL